LQPLWQWNLLLWFNKMQHNLLNCYDKTTIQGENHMNLTKWRTWPWIWIKIFYLIKNAWYNIRLRWKWNIYIIDHNLHKWYWEVMFFRIFIYIISWTF
jgi:hypothetical protein